MHAIVHALSITGSMTWQIPGRGAAVLIARFARTGGAMMLRMMGGGPE